MRDRRNIPRLGKATEAVKRLKSARERAEIDIWFYRINNIESGGSDASTAPSLNLEEYVTVPCWPLDSFDVAFRPLVSEIPEITFLRPKITDLKRFDGLDKSAIQPSIDK